jgi:hypothetical protein
MLFQLPLALLVIIGNCILICIVRSQISKRNSSLAVGIILASLVKAGFLFSTTLALIYFGIIPKQIIASMGLFQIYTALIGGVFALIAHKSRDRFY